MLKITILYAFQTIKSHDAMAQAMKGVTKALTKLNSKISIPGLQKACCPSALLK
jgi:ABC-type uncharacterized transport system substrate-binding protein